MTAPSVSVVVGTFGDEAWSVLACERAIPSAEAEGVPVIHIHHDTLHQARNDGLALVNTEFVVHLDADDSLEPGYVAALSAGTADVRAPRVRYVRNERYADRIAPIMPKVAGHHHACDAQCLGFGNWLVVGALMRTEQVLAVGGWRSFSLYEDWDLMVRLWQAGATFEPVPAAVYRAHARHDSRNRAPKQADKFAAHIEVATANGLPIPGRDW